MPDVIEIGAWVEAGESTLAVTLTAERVAGDLIAVMLTNSSNGVVTAISDSDGNSGYVASGAGVGFDAADSQNVEIWYCKNIVAHAAGTLTITVTTSGTNFRAGHAFLIRGRHLTAPIDATVKVAVSYHDVAAPATGGTLTPDEDNEVVVGIVAYATGPAYTLASGLTLGRLADTYWNATFSAEQTTKTSQNWGYTAPSTGDWGIVVVGFKAAAAGGAGLAEESYRPPLIAVPQVRFW